MASVSFCRNVQNTRSARLMLNAAATACQRMELILPKADGTKLRLDWDSGLLVVVA